MPITSIRTRWRVFVSGFCAFSAPARALASRYDFLAHEVIQEGGSPEPDPEKDQLLALHDSLIEAEASKVMLTLAIGLRVFDDHLKNGPNSEAYAVHVKRKGGNNYIGVNGDPRNRRFSYRDACNAIIHALKLNFLRDRFDRI